MLNAYSKFFLLSIEGGVNSPMNVSSETINWNTATLPKNWERRADPKTHKVYYVDHETRKTQWRHPHNNSNSKATLKKNDDDMSTSLKIIDKSNNYYSNDDDDYIN